MKNKKALTARTIVLFIILVLSFALILLLYYQFNWKGAITDDTCHASIILKKTVPESPISGGKAVDFPLRCQTKKVCLTSGVLDSGCEEFKGLKNVKEIRISDKYDILQILADSMANCWYVVGEAKGPMVFSRQLVSDGELTFQTNFKHGIICSRIAFSEKVKKDFPSISSSDLVYFLQNEKYGEGEEAVNYLEYLAGKQRTIDQESFKDLNVDTSKQYAIIYLESSFTLLPNILAKAGGGLLGGAAIGRIFGGQGAVIGFVGGAYYAGKAEEMLEEKFSGNPKGYHASLQVIDYTPEELNKLNVEAFESLV